MKKLSEESLKLLNSYPQEMVKKAKEAIKEGKAFCPACNWVGMSNCGYFDECGSVILPNGELG